MGLTEGSSVRKSILACVGRGSTPQERVRANVQATGNKWAIHDCLAYRWNTDCKYSGTDSNAHVLVLLHAKSHNNVAYHAYTDECEAYGKRSCRRSAYSIPCRASYFRLRDDFQPVSI